MSPDLVVDLVDRYTARAADAFSTAAIAAPAALDSPAPPRLLDAIGAHVRDIRAVMRLQRA